MFLKRAKANASATYPDFGCSLEMFTNHKFLEIETLGPMRTVRPGESLQHVEHWSLHRDVRLAEISDDAIDRAVLPLITAEGSC
jgi:hypothetical protein